MTDNFLQGKICSNWMTGSHSKNASIMLRPTEVQSLIQDLTYVRVTFQERQSQGFSMRLIAIMRISSTLYVLCMEMYA